MGWSLRVVVQVELIRKFVGNDSTDVFVLYDMNLKSAIRGVLNIIVITLVIRLRGSDDGRPCDEILGSAIWALSSGLSSGGFE